jgi:cytochrome c-type biogenesis protein CcsB
MTTLFNLSLVFYLAGLVLAVVNMIRRRRLLDGLVTASLVATAVLQTVYIGMRWAAAGRAPFSNMFESLVLFSWACVVIYLFVQRRARMPLLGAAASLLGALSLASASTFFGSEIRPLMPALQSNWLTVHVFTCFLGYGGFAVSFLSSVAFLVLSRAGSKATQESRDTLETTMAQTISFGFLFLTIGIITGAVWANSAWGTYWSWDPKETWSLITWFIYAAFLHCRFMRGWRGKRAAWVSIIGFISVLFTYIGVNFLLSGLHSYA